jgi:hypothetical protein
VLEPFSGEEDVQALRDRMAELIAGLDDGGADGTQHHVGDHLSPSLPCFRCFISQHQVLRV